MVRARSPGPIYKLPPVIGYPKHDYSRYRNPQYSMSPRLDGVAERERSPGPKYQIRNMNEHGKASPPAFSLSSRPKGLTSFNPPGPGAYSVEKVPRMKEPRPPMYSMTSRNPMKMTTLGPGPLAYNLPSTLGPKVPNMHANGAFTMAPRVLDLKRFSSPGPANYKGTNTNIYKNKLPQFTMAPRLKDVERVRSPGPAAYLPKKIPGTDAPKYSLGIVYTDAHTPYITADDNMPCINK